MSNDTAAYIREIKILKDQIARLTAQNLELQRQLEELRPAKSDLALESWAALAVNSVRAAEDAIARESPDGKGYVVARLETELRGFIFPGEDQLLVRLPSPERTVPADNLSTLRMTYVQVPPAISRTEPPAPSPKDNLAAALERAQAALTSHEETTEASDFPQVMVHVTRLLEMQPKWTGKKFQTELKKFAETVGRCAATQPLVARKDIRPGRRAAWAELGTALQAAAAAARLTPNELQSLATLLDRLVQQLTEGKG